MGPEDARALSAARDDIAAVLVEQRDVGQWTIWVGSSLAFRFTPADALPAGATIRTF